MKQSKLTPLSIKPELAPTPNKNPQFFIEILNNDKVTEKLADPRATRALIALMNQHAVMGGAAAHWGGPAAFAEIMSSIHAIMFRKNENPWYECYNFVNDAGHTENGIYALRSLYGYDNLEFQDLRGFRSLKSKLTGHGEVHVNPQGVFISNGPLGSAVAQAQGLAMADKLSGNKRTTICTLSDGGSMEGEAKEALSSIPGLFAKNQLNPFVLVLSDNNTKLSGRVDQDSFDMGPYFSSLSNQGWNVIKVEDGHNLQLVHEQIDKAIEQAQNSTQPLCLWVKTIKGRGVKETEDQASGGHGHPLKAYDPKLLDFIKQIYHGDQVPELFLSWAQELVKPPEEKKSSPTQVKKEKVQPGFSRAAIKAAKKGLPIVSVSADLQGSTGIAPFHKEFPERSFDVGVAESNMISIAIGLSKQGYIPIVDTFAQFGVTKGNLPLIMSALSQGPLIALFSHIGFQDAADGASHQATSYLAAVSSIPNIDVICCSCSEEAEALMTMTIENFCKTREKGEVPNSTIFFFGRENHPVSYLENPNYEWQKAQIIKTGNDATLVTSGPMLSLALEASEQLEKEGKSLTVVNLPFINTPDIETLRDCLEKTHGQLITLEDHQLVGGLGAQVCHALTLRDIPFKLRSLANRGHFGQSAYSAKELYQKFEMDADAVIKALYSFS